ncbi:hypothetical protein B0H66DRAFT_584008 [Apodospora peruviana]|uniref:Centrosomin N-terminal motif 1 domain-containing protein n=1 Tax=Apodospora peruviana TaxID=516989 RepID=A0AAE0M1A8_9PEZI|nr:hypothetical protein B0H66DRAFT_584008 [Apodospora peruviana]
MDGYISQGQSNDRSRPPPFPRTASRSSTSSTRTRLSNNSSSASSQQVPSAHSQRFPHTRSARTPNTERPRSQLSREASDDSRQSMPLMSTFLQERLDRERRVESERSSSRASNDRMSGSAELRPGQSSPTKKDNAEGRRPGSSSGAEAASKKKGLGLKEMEQTLSTLHKQNFDLKLELYHRRERQNGIEERLEKLEAEKAQTDQINDQLIEELEKRDKAVEEAVAMIVVLEARVEQLLREREMVRQVEEAGMYYPRSDSPGPMSTPKMKLLDLPRLDDTKDLSRMPSFLSERSENTENLRNVYLGVRGSVVSLPRMGDDAPETDRINSPTLSVLSESSFTSIYGQKHHGGSPSPEVTPGSYDGSTQNRGLPALDSSSQHHATPTRPRQSSALRVTANGLGPFQNINDVLDLGGSPLQRLEKLETTLTAMNNASRPATSYQEKDRPSSRPSQTYAQPRTKQEKRQALQKVLTQGPLGRELPHLHGLPPTPDTISTSTLRRYQNSNDTLSRDQSLVHERSYLALSETTTSQASAFDGRDMPGRAAQPPSTTAFDSLRQLPEDGKLDPHFNIPQSRRPRSASESTVSRNRRDEWDSDGSDDGLADGADSLSSSFDPWLKESLKPNRAGAVDALDPSNSASQAGLGQNNGRISPDLFSFPTGTNGWATGAMFGPIAGSGYMGANRSGLPTPMAETLDALGRSLPTPMFGSGLVSTPNGARDAPPPPNRRSSLHARTGSTTAVLSANSIPPSPARPSPTSAKCNSKSPGKGSRRRSNSTDVVQPLPTPVEKMRDIGRASTVPPKQIHLPPPPAPEPPSQPLPKQRHYPPTASQAPRSRVLNSLFRRSTGSAESVQQPAAPASAPPTEMTFNNLPATMSAMSVGIPSWGRRSSLVEDERASATPPPILRNKGGGSEVDGDGGVPLEPQLSGGAPIGDIPGGEGQQTKPRTSGRAGPGSTLGSGAQPAPAGPEPGRRRWLGLGRVGSMRKSTGGA